MNIVMMVSFKNILAIQTRETGVVKQNGCVLCVQSAGWSLRRSERNRKRDGSPTNKQQGEKRKLAKENRQYLRGSVQCRLSWAAMAPRARRARLAGAVALATAAAADARMHSGVYPGGETRAGTQRGSPESE